MNFIQTLQIGAGKDPFRDSFGWIAPEYHLMSWALSCLQLYKLYGNVTLYANSEAAYLLTETLNLPYTQVCVTHDELNWIHPDLWALPKIYTYSLQEQPFLHIDGDVYIFNLLGSNLLERELIAQNIEVATDYYTSAQKELMRYFTYFPPCVKEDFESGIPIQAVNAGILGGNNVSFFREYASIAFEYIHKNAECLKYSDVNRFNVFFEQHLFFALAREKGISVNVLFEDIVDDNGYTHLGDFHDVPFNRSYLHLLGDFKRDESTCIQMAAKLRELYPDYYERIVAMFHNKNIKLSPCGFNNENILLTKELDEQNNTHLQLLKFVAVHYFQEIEEKLFQDDFELFYKKLMSVLENKFKYDLHKRDLIAQYWSRDLFAETSDILNKSLIRCRETEIIESSFNWAGLFNKCYLTSAKYYLELQINKGQFYNLVVYETSDNGFSLYDIDQLDYIILQLLYEPMSINELLIRMQAYFEDDVLQNNYETYKSLILLLIKQLVIKKAIRPLNLL
jgi:hypothetical protein